MGYHVVSSTGKGGGVLCTIKQVQPGVVGIDMLLVELETLVVRDRACGTVELRASRRLGSKDPKDCVKKTPAHMRHVQ